MIRTGTMSNERFEMLIKYQGRRMTGESTKAAKSVLVEGASIKGAAEKHNISSQVVSDKVKRIKERERRMIEMLEKAGG